MFDRFKDLSYRSVAAVMKRNYIGLAKKYDTVEIWELVDQINETIDKRGTNYHELTLELKARMAAIDMQRKNEGYKFVCIFPSCKRPATHVKITKKDHIVYCDEHYEQYEKMASQISNQMNTNLKKQENKK